MSGVISANTPRVSSRLVASRRVVTNGRSAREFVTADKSRPCAYACVNARTRRAFHSWKRRLYITCAELDVSIFRDGSSILRVADNERRAKCDVRGIPIFPFLIFFISNDGETRKSLWNTPTPPKDANELC